MRWAAAAAVLGLLTFGTQLTAQEAANSDAPGQLKEKPGGATKADGSELNPYTHQHGMNKVDDTAPTAGGKTALSAIKYHGGPVMGSVNAYIIWYGNWNQTNGSDTPAGQALVRNFLGHIGGSSYYISTRRTPRPVVLPRVPSPSRARLPTPGRRGRASPMRACRQS